MTTQSDPGPYSRVYWSIVDDPKFESVYPDDRALSWWLRLLLEAEGNWPASASIPKGCPKSILSRLVSVGIVDLQDNGRFRIHGLDPERMRRSEHGKRAAGARWEHSSQHAGSKPPSNANGNAPSNAQSMPRRDETSIEKTSRAIGLPTDALLTMRAKAVLADQTASEDQKKIATDTLRDLGISA